MHNGVVRKYQSKKKKSPPRALRLIRSIVKKWQIECHRPAPKTISYILHS